MTVSGTGCRKQVSAGLVDTHGLDVPQVMWTHYFHVWYERTVHVTQASLNSCCVQPVLLSLICMTKFNPSYPSYKVFVLVSIILAAGWKWLWEGWFLWCRAGLTIHAGISQQRRHRHAPAFECAYLSHIYLLRKTIILIRKLYRNRK